MSKQAKKALVPELRFPEFRDSEDWVERPIGSVCEVLNNQRKPVTSTARVAGEYPYYGASGIVDYIDDFIFDERLVLVGEDGAKWNAFEPTAFIAEGKYWVNNHAHVLRPIEVSDTLLANYLTMLDLQKYVTGAAPPKLTLGKLKEIPILYPENPDEQKKIAACLSSVAALLASERDKLTALRAHKKGLMQQLFPTEGASVPVLRFPGFKGEWVPAPIGDHVDLLSGFAFEGKDIMEDRNGTRLMRGINITEGAIRHSPEIDRYYLGPVDELERYKLEEGDLVIGMDGSKVGKNSALIDQAEKGTLLVQRVARLRAESRTLIGFIYHHINSLRFHSYVDRINTSSGIPHISAKQIKDFEICFPEEAEQQLINLCLTSLNERISCQGDRITALEEHKRGLMQGLFPSVN